MADSPVLRDLLTGVADIGMSSLVVTNTRIEEGNYSLITSPVVSQYALLIHKNHLSVSDLSSDQVFLTTFSPQVWILLFVLVSLSCSALVLSEKLRSTYYGRGHCWTKVLLEMAMGLLTTSFRK